MRPPRTAGACGAAGTNETLGPRWRDTAIRLVGSGDLRERPDGTFVPRRTDGFPAADVSLRSEQGRILLDNAGHSDKLRLKVTLWRGGTNELPAVVKQEPRAADGIR